MLLRCCGWWRLLIHYLRLFKRQFLSVIGQGKANRDDTVLPIAVQHAAKLQQVRGEVGEMWGEGV